MDVQITEGTSSLELVIKPEQVYEVAQLFRFANNAKAEKPTIHMFFSGDQPELYISLPKFKQGKQVNSISPFSKR